MKYLLASIVLLFCLASPAPAQTYILTPGVNGIVGEDGVSVDLPCPTFTPSRVRIRAISGQLWNAGAENCTDELMPYSGGGFLTELWQHAGIGGMEGVVFLPNWGGAWFGGAPIAPFDGALDFGGPSGRLWDHTYWTSFAYDSWGDPSAWCAQNSPTPGMHRLFLKPLFTDYMEPPELTWYARGVWRLPRVAVTYFP